ncbi:MAG: hypothetical protein AAF747_04260 [Planctomycetota bacterium]
MPNDHLRLLTELLRPIGPELARRWLASLALVPEAERAAIVAEVEKRIAETFGLNEVDQVRPSSPPTPQPNGVEIKPRRSGEPG